MSELHLLLQQPSPN